METSLSLSCPLQHNGPPEPSLALTAGSLRGSPRPCEVSGYCNAGAADEL